MGFGRIAGVIANLFLTALALTVVGLLMYWPFFIKDREKRESAGLGMWVLITYALIGLVILMALFGVLRFLVG